MGLNNTAHLAIDVQNRFLFPADVGTKHRDIGGLEFLRQIQNFDRDLTDFSIPTIWSVSRDPNARLDAVRRDSRFLAQQYDLPASLATGFRGILSPKSLDSAFSNPSLVKRLHRMRITTLLISGLYLRQCVRATVQDAVAAGFYCRIVADLTLDNMSNDTAASRRKRLLDTYLGHPRIEVVTSDEIMREFRWVDSEQLDPLPRGIVVTRHESRMLLHHFHEESRYTAIMREIKRAAPEAADEQDNEMLRSFRSIQDEVT